MIRFYFKILGWTYTFCSYSKILISCTVPSGSPYSSISVWFYTLSELIYCIRSLCDSSFSFNHHITQHLLFGYVLSILALIWLFLKALFCTAIIRDPVSLFRFPVCNVHVLSCEMPLVNRLKHSFCCFSFHVCFLVSVILLVLVLSVLFLEAVLSVLIFSWFGSSNPCHVTFPTFRY